MIIQIANFAYFMNLSSTDWSDVYRETDCDKGVDIFNFSIFKNGVEKCNGPKLWHFVDILYF